MSEKVLDIKDLNFGYTPDKLIYQNFNLEVFRGQIKTIVGMSGTGKTTLLELITKNLKPLSGSIKSLKISSIYQDPYTSFHPSYSIINQIKDVAISFDELDVLLEKIKLSKALIYKKPHELSGGQLQRCSVLRALLMNPDIILADEPTSALDNIIALDVMKVLINFLDRCGIVLITHDIEIAKWCSDEIINLEEL